MYDELVKQLREDKSWVEQGTTNTEQEIAEHIQQAADAIEELSKLHETQKRNLSVLTDELMSRWIPVTERLPKYGERVLVFGGVTMYVAYYDKNRYGGESWHKLNSKSHYCNPTHWMPLPTPPTAEEGE